MCCLRAVVVYCTSRARCNHNTTTCVLMMAVCSNARPGFKNGKRTTQFTVHELSHRSVHRPYRTSVHQQHIAAPCVACHCGTSPNTKSGMQQFVVHTAVRTSLAASCTVLINYTCLFA